jgi:hypothetical protein
METGMDLHEALTQISEIRQQVARTETFRGYRAAPVAFSGLVAWIAAFYQSSSMQSPTMQSPAGELQGYLGLWVGAALLSMVVTGLYMFVHCWQSRLALTRSNTALALGQFVPSVVAGGLLTSVLFYHAPECLWMLPGLWSVLFSLGIFASYRLLPKATFWVGVHYMASAVFCLILGHGDYAFSPWAMALPFGVGQFLAAGILYWTLERPHGES